MLRRLGRGMQVSRMAAPTALVELQVCRGGRHASHVSPLTPISLQFPSPPKKNNLRSSLCMRRSLPAVPLYFISARSSLTNPSPVVGDASHAERCDG